MEFFQTPAPAAQMTSGYCMLNARVLLRCLALLKILMRHPVCWFLRRHDQLSASTGELNRSHWEQELVYPKSNLASWLLFIYTHTYVYICVCVYFFPLCERPISVEGQLALWRPWIAGTQIPRGTRLAAKDKRDTVLCVLGAWAGMFIIFSASEQMSERHHYDSKSQVGAA